MYLYTKFIIYLIISAEQYRCSICKYACVIQNIAIQTTRHTRPIILNDISFDAYVPTNISGIILNILR